MNTKTQPRPGHAGTASNAPRPNRPSPSPSAAVFDEYFPPRQAPQPPPPRPPMQPRQGEPRPTAAPAPTLAEIGAQLARLEAKIDKLLASPAPGASGTAVPLLFTITDADAEEIRQTDGSKKAYYKLFGGEFSKFGVRVWPEVLEAAGIDPANIRAAIGRIAHYTEAPSKEREGMSRKIVRID